MGILKYMRGDQQSKKAISASQGGGKHTKGKGGKHARKGPDLCPYTWKDKGTPGSKHATYPHENHQCGSEPHNRGNHFCRDWNCGATHP